MSNNATGGIILFLAGAAIIGLGITAKGKQILAILTGSGTATGTTAKTSVFSGVKTVTDDTKDTTKSNNTYGMAGETAAGVVNG